MLRKKVIRAARKVTRRFIDCSLGSRPSLAEQLQLVISQCGLRKNFPRAEKIRVLGQLLATRNPRDYNAKSFLDRDNSTDLNYMEKDEIFRESNRFRTMMNQCYASHCDGLQ